MSIRRQILLGIIAPTILVYSVVLTLEFQNFRARSYAMIDAQYQEAVARRADAIERELVVLESMLVARAESLVAHDQLELAQAEDDVTRVLASTNLAESIQVSLQTAGVTSEARIAKDQQGEISKQPDLWPAAHHGDGWRSEREILPLRYGRFAVTRGSIEDGRRLTIQAVVTAQAFATMLREPIVDRSLVLMLDNQGKYLWHYKPDVMQADVDIFTFADKVGRPSIREAATQALCGQPGVTRMPMGFITPEPYLLYYTPIEHTGWTLITAVPEKELMAPAYAQLRQTATAMLIGILLMIALIWVASRRITKPLIAAADSARELKAGDVFPASDIRGPSEVHMLNTALVDMSRSVSDSLVQLKAEVTRREFAEGELRVARQMQESLLPDGAAPDQFAEFGVSVEAINLPALQVAGDFYDFFITGDGHFLVCVADVSGKGARAAMLMAAARTALRTAAGKTSDPASIVSEIHSVLIDTMRDTAVSFVTMQVLVFAKDSSRVRFVNSAHPHAVLRRGSGQTSLVAASTGTIIGAYTGITPVATTDSLQLPNDWSHLVLVTDGVLEAAHTAVGSADRREMFGNERLQQCVRGFEPNGATNQAEKIVESVRRYEGAAASDDVTVVVVSRLNGHTQNGQQ